MLSLFMIVYMLIISQQLIFISVHNSMDVHGTCVYHRALLHELLCSVDRSVMQTQLERMNHINHGKYSRNREKK